MQIQEIRAKREKRAEALKKRQALSVFATPYGHVQLSQVTEDRLDKINPRWREPMPYAYPNRRIKEVFDEITKATMLEWNRGGTLEVY